MTEIERFTNREVDEHQLVQFRPPQELIQPEPNACLSCVVANVMYMFGKMDKPDVKAIDRELSRQPGKPLYDGTAFLFLLQQGFDLKFICPFDEVAFIEKGLEYLKEFYKDTWTGPSFDKFWTPTKLRERREARIAERQLFAVFDSQHSEEARMPTIDDIEAMLDEGQAVYIHLIGSSDSVSHGTLVYGKKSDDTYEIYCPFKNAAQGTCLSVSRQFLEMKFLPEDGIAGIKLIPSRLPN